MVDVQPDPQGNPPDIVDLVDRFRTTVARRSERTAVEGPDATLTYAELDRLSNQLAHHLLSLGVERESLVGISLPRGAGELVALLATAKAGGAYVPLDPSHPPDRLRTIVEDAAPQVMVTYFASPLATAGGASGSLVLLDDLAAVTAGHPSAPPAVSYDVGQLAYILFTSGSTGRPKGVEIVRGALSNFLGSMAHTPGMAEDERLLAITTTSFDIAGLELFLPLWVGATVVIVDRDTARDPIRLRRRLESDVISVMQATPATWRLLLEAGWVGDGQLRILCGGEAIYPALADRLLTAGRELWNLYGPTETTVWSSLDRIEPGCDRITIGRPIDRTQMYILNEALGLVPPGQEGEIWIGGKGLARGYRGRPDLTAERFVPNPHGAPGDLIYRTGDLGRQLDDGRFECLGRLDHQVKIRGFRIELGEIETVLRAVPGVREALVVADQKEGRDPSLIAYWVGDAGRDALVEEARRKLPAYMVPSAYVSLELFPLNTNGKIDRKRLPLPEALKHEGPPQQRPRTDTETRIAAVWCQVLGLAQVGVDQDFSTLGGTSARAIQVVARIRQETGVELSLQAFFEEPTVKGTAARIGQFFSPDDPIVVWLRRGEPSRLPLLCILGVTIYLDLALALEEDRPVIGMHVPCRYVPGRDRQPSIPEVAERYVKLIRRHQARGPYHLLGLCFGGIVAYEVARQLKAAGEEVAFVAILDAVLPHAVRINRLQRLHTNLRRAWHEPQQVGHWLRKNSEQFSSRLPLLRRLSSSRWRGDVQKAIDLPVEGPEVDAEISRFFSTPTRLASRLLVVRATGEPTPSWMQVQPDQGWGELADQVIVHDIPAHHLQILREPHVRSLAWAIAREVEPADAPRPAEILKSQP